jgi:glutamate dehydrogenase/leucine dehydrogenase
VEQAASPERWPGPKLQQTDAGGGRGSAARWLRALGRRATVTVDVMHQARRLQTKVVLVRGSGDVGSAVAHQLFSAGHAVILHDRPRPAPRALATGHGVHRCGVLAKRGDRAEDIRRMLRDCAGRIDTKLCGALEKRAVQNAVREFCVNQLRKVLHGAAEDATGVLVSH